MQLLTFLLNAGLGYKRAGTYTYNLSNPRNLTNGYYIIVLEQNDKVIARKQFIVGR